MKCEENKSKNMILRFAIKSVIYVGAVYYTKVLGVWGDSSETHELLQNVVAAYRPYKDKIVKLLPVNVSKPPETENLQDQIREAYNDGVMKTFKFIANAPGCAFEIMKKYKESLINHLNDKKD